jgi:hypothetical protein
MSADQVAEILPAIREALAGEPDTCVTFALVGKPERWLQFVGGVANAAYPLTDEPSAVLARLGHALLESWEPGKYLTVNLAAGDARSIAKWIDQYFEQVLDAPTDYSLDVKIEVL